jgi:predicted DNA-binding transcriptional regulator YafY
VEEAQGGVVLSGEVSGLAEVERWVLSYGAAAKVLEPKQLRESVAAKLHAGAAAYATEAKATSEKGRR